MTLQLDAPAIIPDGTEGLRVCSLQGARLFSQQLWALLVKRAITARRDRLALWTLLAINRSPFSTSPPFLRFPASLDLFTPRYTPLCASSLICT